jgi:hypothetical protein
MIPCLCVNDADKPNDIPKNKWVVKGNYYHVIYTVTVLPQRQLAFHLAEIDLDESCHPYEYFLANRFAFLEEDIDKLMQLIEDCSDTDFSVGELMEQTHLISQ